MGEEQMYTRREIDLAIVNISTKLGAWDTKLDNIHDQVKAINGRVASSQTDIVSLKSWRSFLAGGLTVITILIVPILLMIAANHLKG